MNQLPRELATGHADAVGWLAPGQRTVLAGFQPGGSHPTRLVMTRLCTQPACISISAAATRASRLPSVRVLAITTVIAWATR
jgi:hypothetical protein